MPLASTFDNHRYQNKQNIFLPFVSLFLVIQFSLCLETVNAQNQWVSIGLEQMIISSMVVDPGDSNVIYAGSRGDFTSGQNGRIFKTTNWGENWDTVLCCVDVTKIVMHPDTSSILYVALGNLSGGGIMKTTNAGTTWFRSNSGMPVGGFTSVVPLAIDSYHPTILYAGLSSDCCSMVSKTTNAGASWNRLPDTTRYSETGVPAVSIDPDNSNTIYMTAGWNPTILKSLDGGENWSFTGLFSYAVQGPMYNLLAIGNNTLLVGMDSALMKSTDGVASWIDIGIDSMFSGFLSIYTDDAVNIVCSSYRGVWETQNGGLSWNNIDNGLSNHPAIIVRSGSKILAGTAHGVFKRDLLTSIDRNEKAQPSNFSLEQNFPNPFNPETIIRYQLPMSSYVTLKIYNTLGEEVAVLVDNQKQSGLNQVHWNSSDMPSGVYLYHLRVDAYTETKKMLLLR